MSQYFDKDFWKFLLGFLAIIVITLVIISAARTDSSLNKKIPSQDSYAKTK